MVSPDDNFVNVALAPSPVCLWQKATRLTGFAGVTLKNEEEVATTGLAIEGMVD